MKISNRQQGMSLLELLIAMAIIAILIVPMVSGLFNSSTQSVVANKETTLASYIAQNHLAELQLADKWPSVGKKSGEVDFAGKEWRWEQNVIKTPEEGLRRVEVSILFGDDGLFTMIGFVGKKE